MNLLYVCDRCVSRYYIIVIEIHFQVISMKRHETSFFVVVVEFIVCVPPWWSGVMTWHPAAVSACWQGARLARGKEVGGLV